MVSVLKTNCQQQYANCINYAVDSMASERPWKCDTNGGEYCYCILIND